MDDDTESHFLNPDVTATGYDCGNVLFGLKLYFNRNFIVIIARVQMKSGRENYEFP